MGKIQFLMDTGGHCFVCLNPTGAGRPSTTPPCQTGDDIGGRITPEEEPNIPKIVSFRNISNYLQINVKEVCQEAMPITAGSLLPILESSELKGVLCLGCSHLFERFSRNFLELDEVKMKVQFSLKSIYDKMAAIDKIDEGRDKEEIQREALRRTQTALKNCFVEQFRRKTMERCSTVAETGRPQVVMKKLEPKVEPEVITIEDDEGVEKEEDVDDKPVGQETFIIIPAGADAPQQITLNLDDLGLLSLSENQIPVVVEEVVHTSTDGSEPDVGSDEVEAGAEMTGTMAPQSPIIVPMVPASPISPPRPPPPPAVLVQEPEMTFQPQVGPDNYSILQAALLTDKRKLCCDLCPRTFKYIANLNRHRQCAHLSKQYNCKYCSKPFADKGSRRGHIKLDCPVKHPPQDHVSSTGSTLSPRTTISTGPASPSTHYECFICNKNFPLQGGQEHERGHPHGKKMLCHVCHLKFEEKSTKIRRSKGDTLPQPVMTLMMAPPNNIQQSDQVATLALVQEPEPILMVRPTENQAPTPLAVLPPPSPAKSISFEFECDICHDLFPTRKAKCDHQRSEHHGMKFRCELCNKTFALRFNKERHQQQCLGANRGEAEAPKLQVKRDKTKVKMKKHKIKTGKSKVAAARHLVLAGVVLATDKDSSSTPTGLESPEGPVKRKQGNENFLQRCKCCGKQFHSQRMMRRHLVAVHGAKHECTYCQKIFKLKRSLQLHVESVHLKTRFECLLCSKKFSHVTTRDRHIKSYCPKRDANTEDPPQKVVEVSDLYQNQTETPAAEGNLLEQETKDMNGQDFTPPPPPEGGEDPTPTILDTTDLLSNAGTEDDDMDMECDVCQEKVSDPATHKCTHFETRLTMNDQGEVEGEEVIPKLPLLTITHPRSPSKKPQSSINRKTGHHKCQVCFKEFPRKCAFQDHWKSAHGNVKFKCNLCGKEFYYRSDYTRHHRDVHMGIRFKCDLCDKMFTQKAGLQEHRQNVHFGKLRFKCKYCPEAFAYSGSRSRHMRRGCLGKNSN